MLSYVYISFVCHFCEFIGLSAWCFCVCICLCFGLFCSAFVFDCDAVAFLYCLAVFAGYLYDHTITVATVTHLHESLSLLSLYAIENHTILTYSLRVNSFEDNRVFYFCEKRMKRRNKKEKKKTVLRVDCVWSSSCNWRIIVFGLEKLFVAVFNKIIFKISIALWATHFQFNFNNSFR